MKITHHILSIPPYISTSWKEIQSLHLQEKTLIITMMNGDRVVIPGLQKEAIEAIFAAHAAFLEAHAQEKSSESTPVPSPFPANMQALFSPEQAQEIHLSLNNLEGMGYLLQHNPSQAHSPDLPAEMLSKIASMAKMVLPNDDPDALPHAEPHCNCVHCQLARAINPQPILLELEEEEQISDEELSFQQWQITQTGEKLYSIVNKLDPKERYSVYLGNPVGCTCGKTGCEHVVAVLQS